MAQQYPSVPPFGNGYPFMPYYSHFPPPSPAQPLSSSAAGYSPSVPQTVTPQANDTRHETVAHNSQQPAPFPFPGAFDPELLKHLPPPPPPLLANFTPVSTASPFSPFPPSLHTSSQPYQQQEFTKYSQPVPQVHSPHNTVAPAGYQATSSLLPVNLEPQQDVVVERPIQANLDPSGQDSGHPITSEEHQNLAPYVVGGRTNGIQNRFQAHEHETREEPLRAVAPANPTPLRLLDFEHQTSRPDVITPASSRAPAKSNSMAPIELREHAKAALLSLFPHKITYDDVLAEGIQPGLLQQLYTELGLSWQTGSDVQGKDRTGHQIVSKILPEQLQADHPSKTSTVGPAAQSSSIGSGPRRMSPTVAAGMERKDRIAQLLAAKTAKTGSVGVTSPSRSPSSVVNNVQPPNQDSRVSNTSLTITPVPPAAQAGPGILQTAEAQRSLDNAWKQAVATTPDHPHENGNLQSMQTPSATAQHPPVTQGFASMIPGLFMAVDEETNGDDFPSSAQIHAPNPTSMLEAAAHHVPTPEARPAVKRPIALISTDATDQASKRVASSHGELVIDAMDVDGSESGEASEGEIIEEETLDTRRVHKYESGKSAPRSALTGYQPNIAKTRAPVETSKLPDSDSVQRRISENEHRRAYNNAQSFTSSPMSSNPPTPAAVKASSTSFFAANNRQDSEPLQSKGTGLGPRPLSKLTPAQLAERAAQLKADLIRQKALRQKSSTEGIPAPDDEVSRLQERIRQSKNKLIEIRHTLSKHEAVLARSREDERQLLVEIERLEKHFKDGSLSQKQFVDDIQQLSRQIESDSRGPLLSEAQPSQPKLIAAADTRVPDTFSPTAKSPTVEQPPSHLGKDVIDAELRTESGLHPVVSKGTTSEPEEVPAVTSAHATDTAMGLEVVQPVDIAMITTPSNSEGTKLSSDQMNSSAGSSASLDLAGQGEAVESFHGSDAGSEDSHMSIDDEEGDSDEQDEGFRSDGSASMSDSGSEDYEPAESGLSQVDDALREESVEYDPETITGGVEQSEKYGDTYEPPADFGTINTLHANNLPSHVPVMTSIAEPTAEALAGIPSQSTQEMSTISLQDPASKADDLENGLQLSEADMLIKPQPQLDNAEPDRAEVLLGSERPSEVRYMPYQSPLSAFKSYRFHPSFGDKVKSGYRSLTYSNNIDPKLPLCPTELSGDTCTDPDCQEQHFSSMALTDDKILVQLSSANDIKDKTLRDKYLLGLKQVIASLRHEGVKEFSQVADALSKYRREWSMAQIGA